MHGQEFLRLAGILESDLAPFLLPGGPMGLFNQMATASSQDDLNVRHAVEHRKFSNGRSTVPEFIDVNDVWYVIVHQKPFKQGFRRLGSSPSLQEKIEYCASVIDGSSSPELFAPDLDADFIQNPPGTPTGFPVPQFFGEEKCELDVPLAQRLAWIPRS